MKDETLGQVFKRYRESAGLKISQVEKDIKINHRMLEALENDDYLALPDEIYIKNIIKAYSRYLSLDYNKLLTLYQAAKTSRPASLKQLSQPPKVIVTPQRVRFALISATVLILLAYLGWQLNQAFIAPQLEVYEPAKDLVTSQNFIEIKGKTEKEARVFINEKEVFLDSSGNFSATLDLQKGLNLIKISAAKKHSQASVVYREILVQ